MLCLSRVPGSGIVIGENIRVVVVSVRGDKVRLGIEAPNSVEVDRDEIRDRKEQGRPPKGEIRMPAVEPQRIKQGAEDGRRPKGRWQMGDEAQR